MKVLLTGASGFLGSHTAECLVQHGYQVRCLVRPSASLNFIKEFTSALELIEGSLENTSSLQQAVAGVDAIIHCAGLIKARTSTDFFNTNASGTLSLLEAARKTTPCLRRFILVSSLAACGAALNNFQPTSGEILPQPVSNYGRSKLQAEVNAIKYAEAFPVTIIRPSIVYGPRDLSMLTLFKAFNRGIIPLIEGGAGAVSTIYVRDAAQALVKAVAAEVPSGNAYFLEDGRTMTWRERYSIWSQAILTGKNIKIPVPNLFLGLTAWANECYGALTKKTVFLTRDKLRELQQTYWVCSSAAASQDLSWKAAVSWVEGSKLTYQWYKKEDWL